MRLLQGYRPTHLTHSHQRRYVFGDRTYIQSTKRSKRLKPSFYNAASFHERIAEGKHIAVTRDV